MAGQPPIYPKSTRTEFPVTTGAKTSDTNVTGAVEAFTVPNDGTVKFYRLRKASVKPLGTCGATRQKIYGAKAASATLLGLIRDRLQNPVNTFNETTKSDEVNFDYGANDYVDFQPGDKCFVGSGVALAAGFQWTLTVEVY